MTFEQQEVPSSEYKSGLFARKETEEQIQRALEENRKELKGIRSKISEIRSTLWRPEFDFLSETKYFYPPKEWSVIDETFEKIQKAVCSISENHDMDVSRDNNITHFLGNGIHIYFGLVSLYMKRLEDRQGKKIEEMDTEDLGGLKKEELDWLERNKGTWDLTLYYLDYMASDENSWALAKEMTDSAGYLEEERIKDCFLEGALINEDLDKLKYFNFFTRLEGNWKSNLKNLRGIDNISELITEDNFDEEFDKLGAEKHINKEKARGYMRRCEQERIRIAV
jgi:hypothetical protein